MRLEEDVEGYGFSVYANEVRAGLVSEARMYGSSWRPCFDLMLGGDLKVAATAG